MWASHVLFGTRGMLWVSSTAPLPRVAILHVGFVHDFATRGMLWVSFMAPLPWVAILHMDLPHVFAAHKVLWVSPTAPLPQVALLHVGFPRAHPHLRVGLLVHLLLWDCGQAPDEVSATLVTTSGALLSMLKNPVEGTSPGLLLGFASICSCHSLCCKHCRAALLHCYSSQLVAAHEATFNMLLHACMYV